MDWGSNMTEIKSIASALSAAQMEMGKALKQSNNPHFRAKYADLGNVMDACLPALNSHGIALIQPTGEDGHGRYVETILIHGESGQSLSCRVPLIVGKNDMQGYGSAVTYARRYGLMTMAGIAPEDDDGHAASKAAPKQDRQQDQPDEAAWFRANLPKMMTADQINSVLGRAKKAGRDVAKLVADRANELNLDFDPESRAYVAPDEIDDEIPY
jgi:hypothetical protein